MKRRQLVSLGDGVLGILFFVSFLSESSTVFIASRSGVSALGVLFESIGSAGMVVIEFGSLFRPEGRLGLGETADSQRHLCNLGAVVLAVAGLALQA